MVPGAWAFFDPYIQYSIYVLNIDCIVPGIFSTWLSCGSHILLMTQQTAWLLTLSHIILYISSCLLIPSMVQKTQKMLNKLLLNWIISLSSKALADVYLVPCLCLILCFFSYLITVKQKAMAPYSSTLGWKIPWAEEHGRLQSMESLRVGHDWATSLSLFTFMHWRRKWQPTPVFLPRESQGRGSLVGCHLLGRTESDTTEVTWQQQQQ